MEMESFQLIIIIIIFIFRKSREELNVEEKHCISLFLSYFIHGHTPFYKNVKKKEAGKLNLLYIKKKTQTNIFSVSFS
jgi:hypothetical protein